MPPITDEMAQKPKFPNGTAGLSSSSVHLRQLAGVVIPLVLAITLGSAAAPPELSPPSSKSKTARLDAATSASAKAPAELLAPTVVDSGRWQFTAGVQWRQIGSLSIRNGFTRASNYLSLPERSFYEEDEEGYYTDGYVLADSANNGQTWNWGYDNASQLNGDQLSFHGQTTRFDETVEVQRFNTDWNDELSGTGLFAEIESPVLFHKRAVSLTAVAGYSFVQDSASHTARAFKTYHAINEVTERYTDTYDVSNLAVPPSAPYAGTFEGPGPLLNTKFVRTPDGSERYHLEEEYISTLRQDFDLKLHTFSLGPRVSLALGRVQAQLGLGFAANVADWELSTEEVLKLDTRSIRTWKDKSSGTSILPGAYGELGLRWEFIRNWSLNAAARYDYGQSLSEPAGETDIDLDLKGFTGRIGVGWNF